MSDAAEQQIILPDSLSADVMESGILNKIVDVTKQTDPDLTKELVKVFIEQALEGSLAWNKNLVTSINTAIETIDKVLSTQLAAIMHDEAIKKLEGSWRGLYYLVKNSELSTTLKIKVLNITKEEIFKDLDQAVEFDQSQLFKKIYEAEFGTPGGEPYSVLIGDYEFTHHPNDINSLRNIAGIAASSFCPFISSVGPSLFGFSSWEELTKPRDLVKIFDSSEYISWRSLREEEDARFLTMVLPRVLARLPYGATTYPISEFDFEEVPNADMRETRALNHTDYCWMNAAYVMAQRLTNAFALYGWCTAIRGAEGGGKVEHLPMHIFRSDDGDLDFTSPTEIGITDRRENELSTLGLLPLCHYKNTDYAVFFGAQTLQKPQKYNLPEATANAAISARLPYLMATSRFAHYLKIMARDKIGSFMEAQEVENWLNRWIMEYVNANPDSGQEIKSEYPLAEAKVKVEEIPSRPGHYNAIVWLRPWLQLEELTASLRLVAHIPKVN